MGKEVPTIEAINQRLKAGRAGVAVLQRGDRLSLRASLPPRPGSGKTKWSQQTIALGIYANPAGLKRAEIEANRVSVMLADRTFDWGLYLDSIADEVPQETIGTWIEKFKAETIIPIRAKGFSDKVAEAEWKAQFWSFGLSSLNPDAPLTVEALKQAIELKPAGTPTRNKTCAMLTRFAKFAGLTVDFSRYRSVKPSKKLKDLPTDDEIIAAIDAFKNPNWQYVAALMATYGLRDHEAFLGEVVKDGRDWVFRVPDDTKTGARDVFPCPVEWVERWKLYEPRLPTANVEINKEYGNRTAAMFRRQGCPFTPYTLRHCAAIRRSVVMGLPVKVVADDLGHSPELMLSTYSRHISKAERRRAHERARNKQEDDDA